MPRDPVGLKYAEPTARVGDWWGRGVATEAFHGGVAVTATALSLYQKLPHRALRMVNFRVIYASIKSLKMEA